MPLVNNATRELHFKLVYDGPSTGGKTTNLRFIQQRAAPTTPDALQHWADDQGRTAFFDYIALPFGTQRGLRTTIHVWATPGADLYAHTRATLLDAADGVVFVADSRPDAATANQARWQDLLAALAEQQRPSVPIMLQFNHRDAVDAVPIHALQAQFGAAYPFVAATASSGQGVLATFKAASDLLLKQR